MWDEFEWDAENVPGLKLGLHILQILMGFVAWCLGIAVFRAEGSTVNGQNGWTFAMFFLTIPAWIYLIGAPRFPRTRKFAEPHVMVGIDSIYTILWLSAFSTQAAFNTANLCGTACTASKAIVAMGVFITLLFGVTTFLSIYTLKYYQFNGRLPGYDKHPAAAGGQNIDPDKAAFSMAPHDDEAYAPVHLNDHDNDHRNDHDDHDGQGYGSSAYGGGGGPGSTYPNSSLGRDPYRDPTPPGGRQQNPFDRPDNPFDDDHAYRPQTQQHGQPGIYAPPHVQDAYDDSQPAKFPAGNYDRVVR